jgi:hypothetical protein
MAPTASLPATSLLPLAPFAHTWVGGDIHGLAAFAGTLYGYVPGMGDVVTALDSQVHTIVTDAGWQGAAASAFTSNWEKISAEINAVGLLVIKAGSIVDQLAANLAAIENALETAASEAAAHGVAIGAAGQPPGVCYANPAQESWRSSYSAFYEQCIADAAEAKAQAAGELLALTDAVTSGKAGAARSGDPGNVGVYLGEAATIAGLLIDLLASPTAYANKVADKLKDARLEMRHAQNAWDNAQKAAREANGRFGKMPDEPKVARANAKAEVRSAEAKLAKAQDGEYGIGRLLATRSTDVPGLSGVTGKFPDGGLLAKAADVPVLDVVLGGLGTVLNAQADVSEGEAWYWAYPLETADTAGTIAVATAVGGAVGGAAVFAGAPVLGVAAGVAAGAVVAYGVGDYVHNLIADAPQQWHEHGVLLGTATAFAAAGVGTWHDTAHLGSDVGHAASSVWHGITSWL